MQWMCFHGRNEHIYTFTTDNSVSSVSQSLCVARQDIYTQFVARNVNRFATFPFPPGSPIYIKVLLLELEPWLSYRKAAPLAEVSDIMLNALSFMLWYPLFANVPLCPWREQGKIHKSPLTTSCSDQKLCEFPNSVFVKLNLRAVLCSARVQNCSQSCIVLHSVDWLQQNCKILVILL